MLIILAGRPSSEKIKERQEGMRKPFIQIFLSTIMLVAAFSFCKKPESSLGQGKPIDTSLSAVVVFSVGDSRIAHSDGTEEKAKLGIVVKTGDRIETGAKGKVDLQFESGTSIRIAPQTILDFAKLSMNTEGGQETQLALTSGKVFADVKKSKKTDGFSVVTPTAIAGVRGTSFIVESNQKTGKASIKVLEGAVVTSPRIPGLDALSKQQIEADENLKKLRDSIQSVEVVVEEGKEASLTAVKDKLNLDSLQAVDTSKLTIDIAKEKPVLTTAKFTMAEEQELKTIVRLDEITTKELIDLNEKGRVSDTADKLAEIEKKKKAIEERLAIKQEEKKKEFESSIAAQPKNFQTNKEIVSYYERIEKIVLSNGNTVVGAIVNQEGNSMIVHTEQGIRKINLDDVDVVIYDFQTKTKF